MATESSQPTSTPNLDENGNLIDPTLNADGTPIDPNATPPVTPEVPATPPVTPEVPATPVEPTNPDVTPEDAPVVEEVTGVQTIGSGQVFDPVYQTKDLNDVFQPRSTYSYGVPAGHIINSGKPITVVGIPDPSDDTITILTMDVLLERRVAGSANPVFIQQYVAGTKISTTVAPRVKPTDYVPSW